MARDTTHNAPHTTQDAIETLSVIKKSVSMRGVIDMTLSVRKFDNRADYLLSWMVNGREMQGVQYHGKRSVMKVFNEIHNNYNDKVKWFDEIK